MTRDPVTRAFSEKKRKRQNNWLDSCGIKTYHAESVQKIFKKKGQKKYLMVFERSNFLSLFNTSGNSKDFFPR